jgi:hypothetical protein
MMSTAAVHADLMNPKTRRRRQIDGISKAR